MYDSAEPLTTEGTDDAVRTELEDRLAAVGRAEQRLAAGTYGIVRPQRGNRFPTIASKPIRPRSSRSRRPPTGVRASTLFRRLPVLGVGEAPAPVGLAGDLLGLQASFGQGPRDATDDAGLGGNVGVPDPTGKLTPAHRLEHRSGITRHRSARSMDPTHVESIAVPRASGSCSSAAVSTSRTAVATDPVGSASIIANAPGNPVSSTTKRCQSASGRRVTLPRGPMASMWSPVPRPRSSPSPGPSRAGRRRSSPSLLRGRTSGWCSGGSPPCRPPVGPAA